MREKRRSPRFDLPSRHDWSVDVHVLGASEHSIVVLSELPFVRHRSYRLSSTESLEQDAHENTIYEPTVEPREATVLWSRQSSPEPKYEVGLRWHEPWDLETDPPEKLAIGPSGGGVSGRIPWQSDFVRNSPPDRAFIAREISLGGMLMETAEVEAPGDPFAVEIPVAGGSFRCLGRIVRTTGGEPTNEEGFLHGVEFLDMRDAEVDLLRRLIEQI